MTLVVVCGSFFAMFWAGQKLSKLPLVWRYAVFASLVLVGAIWPLEAASGWTLSLPYMVPVTLSLFASLAIFALGVGRCVPQIPVWWFLPLAPIPVVAVYVFAGPLIILMLHAEARETVSQGRVSPTLSYRIVPAFVLSDYGGKAYDYVFYRNPRSAPWIYRMVSQGRMPCTPDDPVCSLWVVRADPDDHTVSVSCDFDPLQGKSARTTDISVP